MSYFLKKTNKKRGLYLQIYESYRDPQTKQPRNKSYKALGYVQDLKTDKIPDPVAFYKDEVIKMNEVRKAEKLSGKQKQITDESPVKELGYFPLAAILRRLEVKEDIDRFQSISSFQFSLYSCLCDLIFARTIHPCSKHRTFSQIIPSLWDHGTYSYDQILEAIEFLGKDYKKIIEIFTKHTNETYILDTSHTLFDCTNFYFEIDREDEWRRKGPSKENRRDPILGMGLLLDANAIPLGMELYPGNQSEKPVLRSLITDLKLQHNVTGRTIQVADKGLNCAQNIIEAVDAGDGYLFSKSVKQLSDVEKTWVLLPEGFTEVYDHNGSVLYQYKVCTDTFEYSFKDENGKKINKKIKEKRVLTFNESLARKQRLEITKMVNKAESFCVSQAKKSEFGESAKYVVFTAKSDKSDDNGKVYAKINDDKVKRDMDLCGYNLLVTSEVDMDPVEIYNLYHRLWRIEESFRCLKTELDARPVYLHNEDRIKGHFLICYLAVLLERLFQFKVLENKYGSQEIYEFFRSFKVYKINEHCVANLTRMNRIIDELKKKTYLPLTNYYLKPSEIKRILDHSI